jgi:hypothetical protein
MKGRGSLESVALQMFELLDWTRKYWDEAFKEMKMLRGTVAW